MDCFKSYVCALSAVFFVFFAPVVNVIQTESEQVEYTLSVDEANYEYFYVEMSLRNLQSQPVILRMPRWTPGAYRIRDYGQFVDSLQAFDESSAELRIVKSGIDSWQVNPNGDELHIRYKIKPAYELWSGWNLDSTSALVQGPNVFMYVEGKIQAPQVVRIMLPKNWKAVSPLPHLDTNRFYADNYHTLLDAPFQLGTFSEFGFELHDVSFKLVFDGDIDFSVDSFLVMVKEICQYETDFFGEIPFDKYVFFYKLLPGNYGGGGLEHFNSTVIGLSQNRLANTVLSAAEVTAHEFFHVWNVKRIHPKVFDSYDYTKEVRVKSLWFLEGVTSYYEDLTLLRTHLWERQRFLNELEAQIERLQETDERKEISVEEASWAIWERGYAHRGVSFYNKGEILGLLLDLEIRHATENRVSLDDVLRFMNRRFAKNKQGFRPSDINWAVDSLSHHSFENFFDRYIAGTEELPYKEVLAYAGLDAQLKTFRIPSIGEIAIVGPRHRIVSLEKDGPAWRAGLRKNDYLLQLDGKQVLSASQVYYTIQSKEIGSTVEATVFRDGSRLSFKITIGDEKKVDCEIEPTKHITELQLSIRNGWLQGWTGEVSKKIN